MTTSMDGDLQDLLVAWTGGDLDQARCDQLSSRLAADAALVQAFADEVWMLARLKAVQSTEPRWLRLEDVIGWTATDRNQRLRCVIATERPRRSHLPALFWPWVSAVLAALVVAIAVWRPSPVGAPAPPAPTDGAAAGALAMVMRTVDVVWRSAATHLAVGDAVAVGPMRLSEGQLTLGLINGVQIHVDGPGDWELVDGNRLRCQLGRFRIRVPTDMHGFTVTGPHAAVVDLGTEFGVSVAADETTAVRVFAGRVEVTLLDAHGDPRRRQLLDRDQSVRVDHRSGRIDPLALEPGAFARSLPTVAPALSLDAGYASAVLAAKPWGHWRFERQDDDRIANEVVGGRALRITGTVRLEAARDGNHCLVLDDDAAHPHWLELDGTMTFDQRDDYAIELWLARETPAWAAVLSMMAEKPANRHAHLLEVMATNLHQGDVPGGLRFLHRWPPGREGGVELIAPSVLPFRWHHVVAQQRGARLEMYVDGRLVHSHALAAGGSLDAVRLVIGRMNTLPDTDRRQARRPFAGRIDELAIYRHALDPAAIADHAARGRAESGPP